MSRPTYEQTFMLQYVMQNLALSNRKQFVLLYLIKRKQESSSSHIDKQEMKMIHVARKSQRTLMDLMQ